MSPAPLPSPESVRYEILPFASGEREVLAAPHPLTLTITCSPKHGIDHTVDVACRLSELGHTAIVHLAARIVRGHDHLDAILTRMHGAGVHDVFVVGGDAAEPVGPFSCGAALLPVLRSHSHAPRSIGIPGYPEGHPLIDPAVLIEDLRAKSPGADYMTTQLCFHVDALHRWLVAIRAAGITVPAYLGLPGVIDRRRLLEISLRVGVGASISFLRKQHGIGGLARGNHIVGQLHREAVPLVGGELGVAGVHIFTFNRLLDSIRLVEQASAAVAQARPQLSVWNGNPR